MACLLAAGCSSGTKPNAPATDAAPTLAGVRSAIVAGNYGEAVQGAQSYISSHPKDPDGYFEDARAEALTGNQGHALDALEKAVTSGLANPAQALGDPAFDVVRATDRFAAILSRGAPAASGNAPANGVAAGAGEDRVEISGNSSGTHIRAGDVKLDTSN